MPALTVSGMLRLQAAVFGPDRRRHIASDDQAPNERADCRSYEGDLRVAHDP